MTRAERVFEDIYIWLMLGVFPLFVLPGGYTNITQAKYIFLACATAAFALVRIVFLCINRRARVPSTLATWAVIGFFAACCLSAVLSEYPLRVLMGTGRDEGLPTLLLYVLVFLCASGIRFKRSYILPLALSSAVFSAIGIVQILDKNPLSLYPAQFYYYAAQDIYTARFLSTIGNEGIACAFMCVAVPFMFAYFVTAKSKRSALVLPVMSVMFFLLLYTGVLGGMIGCCAALALACVFLFTSSRRLSRILIGCACLLPAVGAKYLIIPHYSYPELTFSFRTDIIFAGILAAGAVLAAMGALAKLCPFKVNRSRVRGVLMLFAVTLVILAMLFVLCSDAQSGFIYELKEMLQGNISEDFGSNRIRIWSRSLELFAQQPIFGSGPNTVFSRMNIVFERFSPLKGDYVRTSVDNSHNEYLNLLVNVGLMGLLPFVLAQAGVIFKKKKPSPCTYAVIGYMIQSMFLFSICITAPYFWLMLGLANTKTE